MELYDTDNFEAICSRAKYQNIFIAGGRKTYEDFLPVTDKIIRTVIDINADGDIYAPIVNWDDFQLSHVEQFTNDKVSWRVEEWERR